MTDTRRRGRLVDNLPEEEREVFSLVRIQGLTHVEAAEVAGVSVKTGDAAQSLGACPRLVLAMAQQQKGRRDEARETLQAAIRLNDWTPRSADHQDMWTAHILCHEAEALIPQTNFSVPAPAARTAYAGRPRRR